MTDSTPIVRLQEARARVVEAQLAEAGLRALAVALLEAQLADLEADVRVEVAA